MYHLGTDIIEIARIEQAIARWGRRFLERVYTPAELSAYERQTASLAARFAAKEAVMKALGVGPSAAGWRDIEILSRESGQPALNLRGRARDRAALLGLKSLALSLSHSRDYAIAFVMGHRHGVD